MPLLFGVYLFPQVMIASMVSWWLAPLASWQRPRADAGRSANAASVQRKSAIAVAASEVAPPLRSQVTSSKLGRARAA
jgi:hypothetical protein